MAQKAAKDPLQTRTFFVSEDRIRVIYDPFDIHGIRKASEEALEPELEEFFREGKVLVCVGRLDKQKEPLLALEVFLKLREKRRDVKLCFVGGGELEEAVRSRIRYHGLEKEVLITGFRENPFSYMRRAKLLIHTASREGLGRVILEGMALVRHPDPLWRQGRDGEEHSDPTSGRGALPFPFSQRP